jgi:hypothetical protein
LTQKQDETVLAGRTIEPVHLLDLPALFEIGDVGKIHLIVNLLFSEQILYVEITWPSRSNLMRLYCYQRYKN